MLWAYGGGQKTQPNQFFIEDDSNIYLLFNASNEEFCKELYTLIFANERYKKRTL